MSSILSSQGMVFATAMAAVSGTVILLALRLQKSFPASQLSLQLVNSLPQTPRSCISSSDGKKKDKKKKKKKRVHFAEDVVDPIGNSDEYRKLWSRSTNYLISNSANPSSSSSIPEESESEAITNKNDGKLQQQMPANRAALYNGILRDRVLHRASYSYS